MPADRFFQCLTASALLHLLMLAASFPVEPGLAAAQAATVRPPSIEARMNPPLQTVLLRQKSEISAPAASPPRHAAASTVVAESIPDNDPALASAMPGYIDFPITPGFMILSLSIDQSGTVESSEVMYSELSRYATRMIELRFAEANYRPAIKNGQPVKGSLLLKIDITP